MAVVFASEVLGVAPSPSSPAVPIIDLSPSSPSIPNWFPLGAVVTTITVTMSDGSPFTGTVSLGSPYFGDGGIYAVSGTSNPFYLIVDPDGPGVGPEGGNLDHVTLVATQ